MSFGAVSKNVRLVIAQVASNLKIAFNSGEGGILDDELSTARDYLIAQYATGRFGINEDMLKHAAAIEIRFGEGAYPGKGSYLPASKVTPEIAKIRGLRSGEAAYSPAHHTDITTTQELKEKVSWLRDLTGGIPIGAKLGCGNVEKDIRVLVDAGVDFIALDGFGGGTGATDLYVRENVGIQFLRPCRVLLNYFLIWVSKIIFLLSQEGDYALLLILQNALHLVQMLFISAQLH